MAMNFDHASQKPVLALFGLFVFWKTLLLLIVILSPGVGYDTSTSLLSTVEGVSLLNDTPQALPTQLYKFVRWDAIYFTHMADIGHVFEQEWAFGVGLSTPLSFLSKGLESTTLVHEGTVTVITGVLLSHWTHWLSVLQLWALTRLLVGGEKHADSLVPFRAAALHIISPAGVFLSAPCSESLFASLSMAGFLGYVYAVRHFNHGRISIGILTMMGAGLAFGSATIVRGNGILAGITYLVEALSTAFALVTQDFNFSRFFRFTSVIAGGLLIAVGMAVPQVLAFREYCSGRGQELRRPWCNQTIPSIFTWVQSHYWNVGPFRYWTLSNVPLFLLAAPALCLLTFSAVDVMRNPRLLSPSSTKESTKTVFLRERITAISLALPQLVLAVLALTSYHVQIITRLSSGYPLWYIWLAYQSREQGSNTSSIIRWMVIYGLVQAVLYASFLPPA